MNKHKFFELIRNDKNIDFVGKSKFFLTLSAIVLGLGVVSILTRGFNYGVDFKGGTQVHVRFKNPVTANDIRASLEQVQLGEAAVQGFGDQGTNEYLIRVLPQDLNLETGKDEIQKRLDSLSPTSGTPAKVKYSEERMYVSYSGPVDAQKLSQVLSDLPRKDLIVENTTVFGQADNHEYAVQFAGAASRVAVALNKTFGEGSYETLQVEQVGAKVGGKLRAQAVGAVVISIVLILLYVWVRFDLEFAPGGVIALVHDALVILSVFSVFRLQFDLSTIAAVLTIVGFSINDTIVIYDRIRENKGKSKVLDISRLINQSLNETLSRTVLTSGTLFLASLALLIVGGPITFNFALAFVVGVISGTYSTIYIASPVTIWFYNYLQKKKAFA